MPINRDEIPDEERKIMIAAADAVIAWRRSRKEDPVVLKLVDMPDTYVIGELKDCLDVVSCGDPVSRSLLEAMVAVAPTIAVSQAIFVLETLFGEPSIPQAH